MKIMDMSASNCRRQVGLYTMPSSNFSTAAAAAADASFGTSASPSLSPSILPSVLPSASASPPTSALPLALALALTLVLVSAAEGLFLSCSASSWAFDSASSAFFFASHSRVCES